MAKQQELGDLPLERWLNRRVRIRKNGPGSHPWVICMLKEIVGEKCVVLPPGHGKTDTVPLQLVKPHWADSPDLKAEAEEAQKAKEAEGTNVSDNATENPLVAAIKLELDGLLKKEVRFTVAELIDKRTETVGYIEALASAALSLQEQLELVRMAVTEFHTASEQLDALQAKAPS